MAAVARATDHPVRNVRVDPPLLVQHASAVVVGEVSLSDFRDGDGVARAANGATDRWVKFLMVLPKRAAGPSGAPVVIYGHGLTVSKETMLISASTNAELGLATIGIDVPNHGDRQSGEGGYLLDLATPRAFGRLASMPLQGIVDHVSLLEAVREHVGAARPACAHPRRPVRRACARPGRRHAAVPGHLDGRRARRGVRGARTRARRRLPPGLRLGHRRHHLPLAALAAVHGRDPVIGRHRRRVCVDGCRHVAVGPRRQHQSGRAHPRPGNAVVPGLRRGGRDRAQLRERPDDRADRPATRGPQLTPIGVPFDSTGSDAVPADGSGVAQIWPNSSAEFQSFAAHIAFGQQRSVRLLDEWVRGRLAAEGVTG